MLIEAVHVMSSEVPVPFLPAMLMASWGPVGPTLFVFSPLEPHIQLAALSTPESWPPLATVFHASGEMGVV